MNPYRLLHVSRDSDDSMIRQAYLSALRETPPDSDPHRFAALNRAYESIKDERSRISYELFNAEPDGDSPIDALVRRARADGPPEPLPLEAMKNYLRKLAK
jgi:curved DNA-binding protein CbpA